MIRSRDLVLTTEVVHLAIVIFIIENSLYLTRGFQLTSSCIHEPIGRYVTHCSVLFIWCMVHFSHEKE